MISLATNITSLLVMNNLRSSQQAMQTSMERLSSGLRINSAKDDPAGHAIANRMGAQIRGMNQAIRNTNDGISMVQTAEGSLDLINDSFSASANSAFRRSTAPIPQKIGRLFS